MLSCIKALNLLVDLHPIRDAFQPLLKVCHSSLWSKLNRLFKNLEKHKYGSIGLCVREQSASSSPGVLFYTLMEKLQSELYKKLHVCGGEGLNGKSCCRWSLKWKLHSST